MPESLAITSDNQQFVRRTSVKLRQFSRLLNEMTIEEVDPLRIKALVSQMTKTKEHALAQGFAETAEFLAQVLNEISPNQSGFNADKLLLESISQKLLKHSEMLGSETHEIKTTLVAVPEINNETSQVEASSAIQLKQLELIFVTHPSNAYQNVSLKLASTVNTIQQADSLSQALTLSNSNSIIVAPLSEAKNNQPLEDHEIENARPALIYTGGDSSQASRLLALRSGGTGYVLEPIVTQELLKQIKIQRNTKPYRVLVMDDSRSQSKYYEKALAKHNFEVHAINDPKLLLKTLESFQPEIVFMDMRMPDCSGIELALLVRQISNYNHLPIIFLSAEESETKKHQALLSGGTHFMVKPPEKEKLIFYTNLYAQGYRSFVRNFEDTAQF